MSHPVLYRRSDLRCGWVCQVIEHKGKQFQRAGNNLEKAEPQQSGAVQQKPCWSLEKRFSKQAQLFRCL